MYIKIWALITLSLILVFQCSSIVGLSLDEPDIHVLKKGSNISIERSEDLNRLQIFCYPGRNKTLETFFKTVEVVLAIDTSDYRYYEAGNASEVRRLYASSSWFAFAPWKHRAFLLNQYQSSCIGFESAEHYVVSLRTRGVDVFRLSVCALGAAVVWWSGAVARNLVFHYVTGGLLGVGAGLLVVVIMVARYVPKKSGAMVVLLGGSSVLLYSAGLLYANFTELAAEHYPLLVGYVAVSGLVSSCVLYRWGGVTHPRTLQLLDWTLQLLGLAAVFCSSQYVEAALGLCVILFFGRRVGLPKLRLPGFRSRPAARRLLSEEEFEKQGCLATQEALRELRTYVRDSPNAKAWQILGRVKDKERFIEYVSGGPDVTADERELHDHCTTLLTSDESSGEDGSASDQSSEDGAPRDLRKENGNGFDRNGTFPVPPPWGEKGGFANWRGSRCGSVVGDSRSGSAVGNRSRSNTPRVGSSSSFRTASPMHREAKEGRLNDSFSRALKSYERSRRRRLGVMDDDYSYRSDSRGNVMVSDDEEVVA